MSDLVTRLRTYQARTIRFSPWWTDPDGKNNEQVYWKVSEVENSATMIEAADTIERLTTERDEAKRDAERWQADALRLLNERNAAQEERDELVSIADKASKERDALRHELWDLQRGFCNVASSLNKEITGSPRSPMQIARDKGWKCFEDEAYGPLED
jgi:hypothetical protein